MDKKLNIKNIIIKELIYNKKKIKEYYDIYKQNNNNIYSLDDIEPKIPKYEIYFEIENTNTQFANMIRRCIEDEIEIYSLTFDLEDYVSNNLYALFDIIKQRIEAIPINQKYIKENKDKIKIILNKKNKTVDKIEILSKDILFYDKKTKKKIDTKQLFEQNLVLYGNSSYILSPETKSFIGCYYKLYEYSYNGLKYTKINKDIHVNNLFLKKNALPLANNILDSLNIKYIPDRIHLLTYKKNNFYLDTGEEIIIKNIKIIKGINRKNSNAFVSVGNIYYEILDQKPLDKINNTGKSSLISNPSYFKIGYKTYGNIEPKEIIYKMCDNLIYRLKKILLNINVIKKLPYYSDYLEIELINEITVIKITDEYWTLPNVITKYIYLLDPTIKYVGSALVHPDIEKGVIQIKHKEAFTILKKAINKIIEDIEILNNSFK